jgi:hypothetical protein
VIQKRFALLQIMPYHVVDLAPLLSISRMSEWSLFFSLGRLLLWISVIGYIDLLIFLLLLLGRHLVM